MYMLIFVVGLLALWQGAYFLAVDVFAVAKPYLFPSPLGVAQSFGDLCQGGEIFAATGNSLLRCFIGYVISILIGVVIGLLMHRFSFLGKGLKPMILGMQTLPSVCWVPFSILWFGLTPQSVLFVVIMGSTFSVALAVDNAIKNVPAIYLKAAKTMGANATQIYRNVIFPACLPTFVSGLKQSWSFAWRALMAGEIVTTSFVGLGQILEIAQSVNYDINEVTLIMVVIVIVGIIIDKLFFTTIENRMLKKRGLLIEE